MNKLAILQYVFNFLKLLDVAGNVIIVGFIKFFVSMPPASGNPHYTMSEALAELRDAGSKPACVVCNILTWFFKWFVPSNQRKTYDHCTSSMSGMPQNVNAS